MKAFEILSEAPNLPPGTTTSAGGIVIPQSTANQIAASDAQQAKDKADARANKKANIRQSRYNKMHPVKSRLGNIFGYDPNKDPKKYAKDLASRREKLQAELANKQKPFSPKFVSFLKIFNLAVVTVPELVNWWNDNENNDILYKEGQISAVTYEFAKKYYNWRLLRVVAPATALVLTERVINFLLIGRAATLPALAAEAAGGPPGWVIMLFHTAALVGITYLAQTKWFQTQLSQNIEMLIIRWLMGMNSEEFDAANRDLENQLKAVSDQQDKDLNQLKALQQKVNPD